MNDKLIAYIQEKYKAEDGARTSLWSSGNGDDVFYDGVAYGRADTLKEIADLIGLEVKPLEEQVYD